MRNEAYQKDIDFLIFKKNIENDKDHVIRYCFSEDSSPLYYSSFGKFDVDKLNKCENCGSKRIFEFQINSTFL